MLCRFLAGQGMISDDYQQGSVTSGDGVVATAGNISAAKILMEQTK